MLRKTEMLTIKDMIDKTAAQRIPISVSLEITYRCNLKCLHCYICESPGAELSLGEIKSIIDQLAQQGTLFLALTGGEIFTRSDVLDIARYAKQKAFAVTLLTTGTLIEPSIADAVRDIGVKAVSISLYGATGQTHDKITEVRGSYNRTINGIRLLRERKVPVVAKFLLMKENIGEHARMKSLAERLGVKHRTSAALFPRRDGATAPLDHGISDTEYEAMFSDALEDSERQGQLLCNAGKNFCRISPSGDVYPCTMLSIKAGSLKTNSFSEIWTGAEVFHTLNSIKLSDLSGECRECPKKDYCYRCSAVSFTEHGDLLGPSSQACRIAAIHHRVVNQKNRSGVVLNSG